MTPDPPEPPTPTGREYPARITTTFNNSHVMRFYHNDELLTGGVAAINELTNIDPFIASESGSYPISAKIKAYDNTHPDWRDSYYDDAVACTIAGGSTFDIGSRDEGTGFTFTQLNTASLSVSTFGP